MMTTSSRLVSDALWVLLVPPGMTAAWYVLSRGWTNMLATTNTPVVKGWMRSGTWILMVALYIVGIAFFIYAHFLKS